MNEVCIHHHQDWRANLIGLQSVDVCKFLYFGCVLFIRGGMKLFFPTETECKLIVVHYSCLLLCLEQTTPVRVTIQHGLKYAAWTENQRVTNNNNNNKWPRSSFTLVDSQSELFPLRYGQNNPHTRRISCLLPELSTLYHSLHQHSSFSYYGCLLLFCSCM